MLTLSKCSLQAVTSMYYAMHREVAPHERLPSIYSFANDLLSKEFVFSDERGFIIVKDISTPLLPDRPKQYLGEVVYLLPEYRKTRALADYYKFLFNYFDGDIVGIVEVGSDHEAVVSKRGTKLGTLYTFNEHTFKKDS